MNPHLASRVVAAGILALVSFAHAQQLSTDELSDVKNRLAEGATHSWEIGTRAQALVEYDTPSYSVLNDSSLPPPQSSAPSSLGDVLSIARGVVQNLTNVGQGPQPLIGGTTSGEAAGDPASIGFAVLLANWTGAGTSDKLNYAGAAQDQLQYLLEKVPRSAEGAISHRVENVQLWSDSVYMVPPFLAYYGVLTHNQTLVQLAYEQCRVYRQALVDDDAGGMWRHIAGNSSDNGHWTTGNGWAAAGMLRVLGTIRHSQYSKSMKSQAKDLANWVSDIHNGIYPHLQTTGLFKNYADDSTSFEDASGTAILASTVYRLALLTGIHTNVPNAEKSRTALFASSSSSSSSDAPASTSTAPASSSTAITPLVHISSDGWLTPVVNPYNIGVEGGHSPEGEAFVLELQAAWRDWAALGSPGQNGTAARASAGLAALAMAALCAAFLLGC